MGRIAEIDNAESRLEEVESKDLSSKVKEKHVRVKKKKQKVSEILKYI